MPKHAIWRKLGGSMGAVPSIKVLLVDDHHLFREGLRTVLASA